MAARVGFDTSVSDLTPNSFTLNVRWLPTCGIGTQRILSVTPENVVCPTLKGAAIGDAWQSFLCSRTSPALPSQLAYRGSPTWSGYAFVPAVAEEQTAIPGCVRTEGKNCMACSFTPTFSSAAAGQRWRFTCSHMPDNAIVRVTFKGTPTVTDGTPDNKIWNAGIWLTVATDDEPICPNLGAKCWGEHRYSAVWTTSILQMTYACRTAASRMSRCRFFGVRRAQAKLLVR